MTPAVAPPSPPRLVRNPGAAFDRDWVLAARVDTAAVQQRADALAEESATAPPDWLWRAVRCLDLTTLAGDDTPERIATLAARARQPLPPALLAARPDRATPLAVAALCLYPALVPTAVPLLAGSGVAVCSVAGGFPAGQLPLPLKLAEIAWVVEAGAQEVDVVIARANVLRGAWSALYDEVRAFKAACGPAGLKVILATGELATLEQVARASRTCLLAGADVIKTSTGKEAVNATLPAGLVMAQAIRDHLARSGHLAGIKPAGGIRTAADVRAWQTLVHHELGPDWLEPDRFRIGASVVLTDIERELAGGRSITG